MQLFTREDLRALVSRHEAPCVSMYVSMGRSSSDGPQNALRFRHALEAAREALERKEEWGDAARSILEAVASLDQPGFWTAQRGTLAVFASPEYHRVWQFAETMPEVVVVSDSFHTKCLVKRLQEDGRYYVLALTKENVTLFEGTNETLDVVRIRGMPRGMHELEPTKYEHGVSKRATTSTSSSGGGAVYFGSSGASHSDEQKNDLKSLFRLVDKALLPVTHDQRAPLILATFDHHAGMFREVSSNPALLEARIDADPGSMSLDDLRQRALDILKPGRRRRLEEIADAYGAAVGRQRGTNHLPSISKAAVEGRVQTLLIEDGRRIAGRLDRATGEITEMSSAPGAAGDDLLDDAAETVLASGGRVYVLPRAIMPTDVGAAAIYRY